MNPPEDHNSISPILPEVEWLRLLADRSEQVFWVMALDPPRMTFVSPAFERIWKTPVSTVMVDPRAWMDTIVAQDSERIQLLYQSILNGETDRYDVTYRIIDGHGAIRWIRDTGLVVPSPDGTGRMVVGIAEDSTELHRTAHEMRQRADWFSLVMGQVPYILWTVDHKLRFTSVAGLGLERLGMRNTDLLGTSLFEAFRTQDHEFLPIRKHLEVLGGDEREYELDWEGHIYDVRLRPFHDAQGQIIGVIGTALDVTDPKNAAQILSESEATYRTLIENNPDLVALVVEGKIRYINESLQRVTGYTPEEMVGRSPAEFVVPEDRERAAGRMREVMAGMPPRPSEYCTHKKNGELRTIEVLSVRISYQGKPAMVAFIRDVTQRKQAEDEIRRHGEVLERLIAERTAQVQELERQRAEHEKLAATGRMAARVAHEINNPLAGIKSAFELIRRAVPPSHPHYDFVGRIDREIARIADITRIMYSLYRPGEVEWQLVSVDVCLRDIVALLALSAQKRGVGVDVEVAKCEPVHLPCGWLEQVLYNLIQNAVDASPPGKSVYVRGGVEDGRLTLTVLDRGRGIPHDLQTRIFEPFFTSKTEGEPKGLGLGLSVTRSLVESLGGSIGFESQPGHGTTFTVVLPVKA